MSKKEIRVMVIGAAGEMGRKCIRFCTERGATVVAAIGRNHHLGEDAGTVAGIDELGVAIQAPDQVVEALERTHPDIVCDCSSSLQNVAPNVRLCIEHGANVAMTGEEAYYPVIDEPKLTAELDALAKEHGVTVIGLGMQDVNWSGECIVMAANCHKISSIYGENWCILDHCGEFEIGLVGVDRDEKEFFEYHKDDLNPRSPYTYALYEIADGMDLRVTDEVNTRIEPLFAKADYDATETWYRKVIPAGKTIGAALSTTLKTEEGIDITGRFIYSFAEGGQPGVNIWRYDGEPSFEVTTDDPRPDIGTTTDLVNRIPDIIKARPGFLTVKDLPMPIYHAHPLPEYL